MRSLRLLSPILLLACFLPATLFSQPEFFGYFESEFDGARIGGQDYSYGYNKLRVDLQAYPSGAVTVRANLNIRRYHGQTEWDFLDFLPERIWQPFAEMTGDSSMLYLLTDTLYLDNAYLKARFERFDLTVGKQQLSLGTGYAWNPTDIFNRKDLMDPTYEQTGVTSIRAEVPLGNRIALDFILAPGESWDSSAKMVIGKIGLGSFDFTGSYTEYVSSYPYWRLGDQSMPPAELTYRRVGGSVVGQLWEFGLWAEGMFDTGEHPFDFDEVLVGIDHTFDFQTYIMLEFYHNSAGADHDKLTFNDYLYYLSGTTHSLMKDYVFLMANHPVSDLLSASLYGIANLNDESFVVNPLLDWNAFENVNVSLFLSYAVGDKDTEFGLQEWAWRLRVRAFF